ncbi:MAG: PepSY-associated TM helix domain-containing protein [Pseudomonadota bacterium]
MDRARHLRNYDVHSWLGITLGFFVFIIAFTGSLALFDEELRTWEDPARRLAFTTEGPDIDPVFQAFTEEMAEEGQINQLFIAFPNEIEPYYTARAFIEPEEGERFFEYRRWNSETLELIPERGEGLSTWLLDIHRDLMWPDELGGRTAGRSLVGVIGIILMLAIITGVVAHTKIFQELFSLRYWRSVRLKWQDTHKVAGLWGLPFYAMISTTGAFLGIVAILSPIVAVLAFKGDTEALIDAVLGAPPEPVGVQAQMLSMDDLEQMRHPESGYRADRVIIQNWNDENAIFDVLFVAHTNLANFDTITINGATGNPATSVISDSTLSPANRVTNAVTPLHYGTYGGIALKLVYFLMGLSLAIITAMGNMMWIERRLHGNEGNKSENFYRRLGRFNVGVTMGLPIASVAIFYLDKLYGGAEAGRLAATGWTYFAVWFAGIGYAMARQNEYQSVRDMLALIGLGLLGLPVLNGVTTGDFFWSALQGGHTTSAWVDVACPVLGIATLAVSRVLPAVRPERKKAGQAQTDEEDKSLVPAE